MSGQEVLTLWPARKRYPDELVARGVRLALESDWPIAHVRADFGMHPETLRKKVRGRGGHRLVRVLGRLQGQHWSPPSVRMCWGVRTSRSELLQGKPCDAMPAIR